MRHDDAYLLDMLLAAREARKFAADLTFEAFKRNRMVQLAILKAVEIVGEAASRVSATGKEEHPEIPWAEIVGMRNRLVDTLPSTCSVFGKPWRQIFRA